MSYGSLPKQWVNAAVVFVQHRLVSQFAEQTQQSREAIYRDARRVKQQLEDREAAQSQLQSQVDKLQAENDLLRRQAELSPFEDSEKVAKYAAQAQSEGVSLPVAQRLLKTLQETGHHRSRRSAVVRKMLNKKRR